MSNSLFLSNFIVSSIYTHNPQKWQPGQVLFIVWILPISTTFLKKSSLRVRRYLVFDSSNPIFRYFRVRISGFVVFLDYILMKKYNHILSDVRSDVKQFFENTFARVIFDGPDLKAKEIQKNPFMVVSTHRSHIDYMLVGHMLMEKEFRNMRFAAGDNLMKLPYIGRRFRAFGAFTVERDGGFERNYVRNLCNKVVSMMEKKHAVIVFPEGGRSYSGAMMEIKNGIIGASVLSQAKDLERDVHYLPIAISYEYPPDVPYFKALLQGKRLRKRNNPFYKRIIGNLYYFGADLMAFGPMLFPKKIRKNHGNVYVDYLSPISVRSIVDIESNKSEDARDEFSSHRISMLQMGKEIHRQFLSLYRLLPMHVVSVIVNGKKCVERDQVMEAVPSVVEKLRDANRNVKTLDSLSPGEIVDQGIRQLIRLGGIKTSKNVLRVLKPGIIAYCATIAEEKGRE